MFNMLVCSSGLCLKPDARRYLALLHVAGENVCQGLVLITPSLKLGVTSLSHWNCTLISEMRGRAKLYYFQWD